MDFQGPSYCVIFFCCTHILTIIPPFLSSSNILVDGKFNARLTDFGLAKAIEESTETPTGSQINHLLTPEQRTLSEAYMAPENEISMEADMYSFGVVSIRVYQGSVFLWFF